MVPGPGSSTTQARLVYVFRLGRLQGKCSGSYQFLIPLPLPDFQRAPEHLRRFFVPPLVEEALAVMLADEVEVVRDVGVSFAPASYLKEEPVALVEATLPLVDMREPEAVGD